MLSSTILDAAVKGTIVVVIGIVTYTIIDRASLSGIFVSRHTINEERFTRIEESIATKASKRAVEDIDRKTQRNSDRIRNNISEIMQVKSLLIENNAKLDMIIEHFLKISPKPQTIIKVPQTQISPPPDTTTTITTTTE